MSNCDPANCETCVGGVCKECGGDPNKYCCNDGHNHCCPVGHECCGEAGCCGESTCETCVGGECKVCGGDTTKCCLNSMCEKKCDPEGEYCTWTYPPIQSNCPPFAPDDLSCNPLDEGSTCGWLVYQTFYPDSAKCNCTGCERVRNGSCVLLKPKVCGNTWTFGLGFVCNCKDAYEGLLNDYRGDHYDCE